MRLAYLSLVLTLTLFSNAYGDTFDLDGRTTLDEIKNKVNLKKVDGSHSVYIATSLPSSHPAFDKYILYFDKNDNLYKINAVSKIFVGEDLNEPFKLFQDVRRQLVAKYGINYIKDGPSKLSKNEPATICWYPRSVIDGDLFEVDLEYMFRSTSLTITFSNAPDYAKTDSFKQVEAL